MGELSEGLFAELRDAFRAEAETVQRYTYFAQVAEIEGHQVVAKLFGDLAESVACVAHGHLDLLGQTADPTTDQPIGETPLNLAAALTGELREADDVYTRLTSLAHNEGHADVASWLTNLSALKKAHVAKLDQALDDFLGRVVTGPGEPARQRDGAADE